MIENNLKASQMSQAGEVFERRVIERRSPAYMIQATNYELAIRERDEALAEVARLKAQQAPIQSGEFADDYRLIAHLIGSIFHAGDFVAETANEHLLEALLIKVGRRYRSWDEIDSGTETIAAPAAQQQASTVPAGWKIVPVKPTKDMIYEGGEGRRDQLVDSACVYAAMLAAAPQPPAAPAHALTDADIERMWRAHVVPVFGMNGINAHVFARAIERHITGQAGGGE